MADKSALEELEQHVAGVLSEQVLATSIEHNELIVSVRVDQIVKIITLTKIGYPNTLKIQKLMYVL